MSDFVGTRKELINKYGSFIVKQLKGTGIYPGTLITQLIVESSGKIAGQNLVGGSKLSRIARNYFGIKAGTQYKGQKYCIKTQEFNDNTSYYINDCFRAYNSIEESIIDYIKFLKENPRYTRVFRATSVKDQFERLQIAGYATNPNYANFLNSVYEPLKNDIDNIKEPVFNINTIFSIASAFAVLYSVYELYIKNDE